MARKEESDYGEIYRFRSYEGRRGQIGLRLQSGIFIGRVGEAGQLHIFDSKIPNTVKVGKSVYYSEPLLEYAPGCKACKAYQNLAKELVENEG